MFKRSFLVFALLAPSLSLSAQPFNDDFNDASQLTGNSGSIRGSTVDAGAEAEEPFHADNEGGASIWYYWNAPRQGIYRFDTVGSNFDTLLAVYRGSSLANLSLTAENDQAAGDVTSSVVFNTQQNEDYEIAIDGYNDGTGPESGSTQLTWEQINPPQADFNGDDNNDLLLFAPKSGATRIFRMQDRFLLGSSNGPRLPASFEVSDTGDFDLDGQPDLVLRNVKNNRTALWLMEGTNFLAAFNGPTLPRNFYLASVDDFNDDGEEDYLIVNRGNRRTVLWNLVAGEFVSAFNGPILPRNWEVAGAADINTDGNPDFVIYHRASGKTAFWIWNGNRVVQSIKGPTIPAGFRLTMVGDYDQDGLADLGLLSTRTGFGYFWKMNRAKFVSTHRGPRIPAGFGIAAPR